MVQETKEASPQYSSKALSRATSTDVIPKPPPKLKNKGVNNLKKAPEGNCSYAAQARKPDEYGKSGKGGIFKDFMLLRVLSDRFPFTAKSSSIKAAALKHLHRASRMLGTLLKLLPCRLL